MLPSLFHIDITIHYTQIIESVLIEESEFLSLHKSHTQIIESVLIEESE